MDVRFCRVQEPSAERQTCAAAAPDPTSNALSKARTGNSCFSVDKDLHGCRLCSKGYELLVREIYQQMLAQDQAGNVVVEHDVQKQGRATSHQLDVYC
jgi:hypothetical protein